MPEDQLTGFRLGLGHNPLFQSDLVGQGRTGHGPVKPGRSDRHEEDCHCENYGKPESGGAHDVDGSTEIRVVEELRVERKREAEIEQNAAPDDEMVETRPVRRVQGTLHA